MHSSLKLLGGVGVGAMLMLFLDPERGARRRALVRDKAVRGVRRAGDFLGSAARDLQNRSEGLAARTRGLFGDAEAGDDVMVARVRAKLGRFVSHPRAIEVSAHQGLVTLSGPILAHEQNPLIMAIGSINGVTSIDDRLEPHPNAGSVSALQGGSPPPGEPSEFLQENWTPAIRLMAGAAGSTLAVYGATRRDLVGWSLAIVGAGLAARGVTNTGVRRLVSRDARTAEVSA